VVGSHMFYRAGGSNSFTDGSHLVSKWVAVVSKKWCLFVELYSSTVQGASLVYTVEHCVSGRYDVDSPSDQMSLIRFRARPFHIILH